MTQDQGNQEPQPPRHILARSIGIALAVSAGYVAFELIGIGTKSLWAFMVLIVGGSFVGNVLGVFLAHSLTHMTVKPTPGVMLLLLRIVAVLYALTGGFALAAAFESRPRVRIAQAVLWFSLCIVHLCIAARIKCRANASEHGDSSKATQ